MNRLNKLVDRVQDAYRELYGEGFISLHRPWIGEAEKKAVNECLDSGWVSTAGKLPTQFSQAIAHYCGADYAVPTNTGTAALHLAMLCAGVTERTEVLCPDICFAATAASVVYAGGHPVFLDIDRKDLGLCPLALEKFLKQQVVRTGSVSINKRTGRKIAAVVVMHNVGFPAQVDAIKKLCRDYHLLLIEDAAESLGSSLDKKMTGRFGDLGVYSFNGNKIITAGGGGILVTSHQELYQRALHLANTAKTDHPYAYVHDEIGYNYRLPSLNAALGKAQLSQLPQFLERKREQFEWLKERLHCENLQILQAPRGQQNHWFIVGKLCGIDQAMFLKELNSRMIQCRPLWSYLSRMAPYRRFQRTQNPVAETLSQSIVCLPNGVASL